VPAGTTLHKILLEATLSKINDGRRQYGLPAANPNDLLYFKPNREPVKPVNELQEPLTDLSTAQDILKRIQTKSAPQAEAEPDKGTWYVLLDTVNTAHYNFFLFRQNDRYEAPGSPGFGGIYWHANWPSDVAGQGPGIGRTLQKVDGVFKNATKFR
jgi:hypothetical protein